MRLTKGKSKIVGVRVGEMSLNTLQHERTRLSVSFVLLGDPETMDGLNAGRYTKESQWSNKAQEALGVFLDVLEQEAIHELFEVSEDDDGATEATRKKDGKALSFPNVPTLGNNGKGVPQV